MHKVSIVIPAYNASSVIEKCVQSILKQTYAFFEIIIINDGSSDNTLDICRKMSSIDDRIKIVDKVNSGVSDSRNIGIKQASGKYIMFIDADDYIDKDMLDKMINIFKENNDVDMVVSGYFKEYKNKTIIKTNCKKVVNGIEFKKMIINDDIIPALWGKLYKTSIVKKYLLNKSLRMAEDFDYLMKLSEELSNVQLLSESYYHYVQSDGSVTSNCSLDKFEDEINTVNHYLNKEKKLYKQLSIKYLKDLLIAVFRYKNSNRNEIYKYIKKIKEYSILCVFNKNIKIKEKIKFILIKGGIL